MLLYLGMQQRRSECVAVAEGAAGPPAMLPRTIERGSAQTCIAVVVAWRESPMEMVMVVVVVVVVMGAAAAGGAGSATVAGTAVARLHVAHGRGVTRLQRQVGRQVAGRIVHRANVAVVLLLQHAHTVLVLLTVFLTKYCKNYRLPKNHIRFLLRPFLFSIT